MRAFQYLDSHTEGEPTRLILSGFPDLEGETLREKSLWFQEHCGGIRKGLLLEPRGFPAMVGCLLLPAENQDSAGSLIFFNNRGVLRMCGHGTMGAAASLAFMDRAEPGWVQFDTPEGSVKALIAEDGRTVEIANVISRRYVKDAIVDVPGIGPVRGDIAYGGNWFFLVEDSPVPVTADLIPNLTSWTMRVREALWHQGITGEDGQEIDHIEVFGKSPTKGIKSRNFVLCPGGEFDRSPCGTGTSAKLACLAADRKLKPGETWIQESIIGSSFSGRYQTAENGIHPFVSGRAFVTGQGELLFDNDDPFVEGLPFGDAS